MERTDITPTPDPHMPERIRRLLATASAYVPRSTQPTSAAGLTIALTVAAYHRYPVLSQDCEHRMCRNAVQAVTRRHEVTEAQLAEGLAALAITPRFTGFSDDELAELRSAYLREVASYEAAADEAEQVSNELERRAVIRLLGLPEVQPTRAEVVAELHRAAAVEYAYAEARRDRLTREDRVNGHLIGGAS